MPTRSEPIECREHKKVCRCCCSPHLRDAGPGALFRLVNVRRLPLSASTHCQICCSYCKSVSVSQTLLPWYIFSSHYTLSVHCWWSGQHSCEVGPGWQAEQCFHVHEEPPVWVKHTRFISITTIYCFTKLLYTSPMYFCSCSYSSSYYLCYCR